MISSFPRAIFLPFLLLHTHKHKIVHEMLKPEGKGRQQGLLETSRQFFHFGKMHSEALISRTEKGITGK